MTDGVKLDVEDQRSVRLDAVGTSLAVTKLGRNIEDSLATLAKELETLYFLL